LKDVDYFEADNLFVGIFLIHIFNKLWDFQPLFEHSWGLIFVFTEKSVWQHLFVRDVTKKAVTWEHQLVFWLWLYFLLLYQKGWGPCKLVLCSFTQPFPLSADLSCRDGFLPGTAASSPTNASGCVSHLLCRTFFSETFVGILVFLVSDPVGYTDNTHSLSLNYMVQARLLRPLLWKCLRRMSWPSREVLQRSWKCPLIL